MKTTIDIANSLFTESKRLAQKRGKTFKEIVELALRQFLDKNLKISDDFKLKKNVFTGQGLCDGVEEGNWNVICDEIYKGRGS